MPEVTFADDEESVEALGSDRADESFGVRVGLRGAPRCADDLDAFGAEDLIEGGSETLVPIMDEEADRCVPVFAGVGEVAGDLRAPRHVRGTGGDTADEHTACVEVDEEENVQGAEAD